MWSSSLISWLVSIISGLFWKLIFYHEIWTSHTHDESWGDHQFLGTPQYHHHITIISPSYHLDITIILHVTTMLSSYVCILPSFPSFLINFSLFIFIRLSTQYSQHMVQIGGPCDHIVFCFLLLKHSLNLN